MEVSQTGRRRAIAVAAWLLVSYGAAQAADYCAVVPNTCATKDGTAERGRTAAGLHFYLRTDGSGCMGYFGQTPDCKPNVFSKVYGRTPWLVACYVEEDSRVCSASDGHATKMRVHESKGWLLGIGHNNYPDSPVRVEVSKKTRELAVNDGWLPSTRFGEFFQLMTGAKSLPVEWVEEEGVQWGPKWRPSTPDAKLVRAVFDYMSWAVRHKDLSVLAEWSPGAQVPEKPNLSVADCYSLRLGARLEEALRALGGPSKLEDDFVNSAGVRGVTVHWTTDTAMCEARFSPLLTRYSIDDPRNFESKKQRR